MEGGQKGQYQAERIAADAGYELALAMGGRGGSQDPCWGSLSRLVRFADPICALAKGDERLWQRLAQAASANENPLARA